MSRDTSLHDNIYKLADHAVRRGQAARLPRTARQGSRVESGENATLTALPATRDVDTGNGSRVPPHTSGSSSSPLLPPSLVATIANCPIIRIDNRNVYLLGRLGIAWRDAIGWRWAASIGGPAHDIWNTAFTAALDERAKQW